MDDQDHARPPGAGERLIGPGKRSRRAGWQLVCREHRLRSIQHPRDPRPVAAADGRSADVPADHRRAAGLPAAGRLSWHLKISRSVLPGLGQRTGDQRPAGHGLPEPEPPVDSLLQPLHHRRPHHTHQRRRAVAADLPGLRGEQPRVGAGGHRQYFHRTVPDRLAADPRYAGAVSRLHHPHHLLRQKGPRGNRQTSRRQHRPVEPRGGDVFRHARHQGVRAGERPR